VASSPLLDRTLDAFFSQTAPLAVGDRLVIAFSGGPDSTALLAGLARVAPRWGLTLTAAHLDHACDPGSSERAERARVLAAALGVEIVVSRRPIDSHRRPGESFEAAARRVRYGFLEEVRRARGGRYIATAHHRDDQAETVLLRLIYGSGLEGLSGIRPRHGHRVRPLLGLGRGELAASLRATGLEPSDDPTNRDLSAARNRVRHELLPALEAAEPGIAQRLARVAEAALGARRAVERRLRTVLEAEPTGPTEATEAGETAARGVDRQAFASLPEPLRPHALALLHRSAGALYPASRAAARELARQLDELAEGSGTECVGCDCPGGWRWRSAGERLILDRRDRHGPGAPPFSYTLEVPGEVEIPELGLTVRVERGPVAPWMFRGSRRRAALALPVRAGDRLGVRNRRPGDRIRPLGAPGTRKLKDLLIDRHVPREARDRLPLLCLGARIAWVPGVTVDESFRIAGEGETWIAEVLP
jgi:tRNA(Ile)-lysidine synthase